MGRPTRQDWRHSESLRTAEIGTPLVLEMTSGSGKLTRGELVEVGLEDFTIVGAAKKEITLWICHVRRWRRGTAFQPGDYVVQRGRSASQWRGVITAALGDENEIETSLGTTELLYSDEIELVHAMANNELPPIKPGPVARDPAAEITNSRRYVW